ncbi:MAG: DUF4412 domain-containing protein [Ignavibacteriaceae bacterium]|nr:DUF4412 domain-containing protein [Ignavibacteriaceae bacterium]
MVTKKLLTVLILFSATLFVFPQKGFEGKLAMTIEAAGQKTSMDYLMKGDKIRIEVKDGEASAVIMDNKAKKMIVVIPSQKMYMELDNGKKGKNKSESNLKKKQSMDEMKKTGETKKINGYTCEKWVMNDNNRNIEAWVTEELGNFFFAQNPMGGNDGPAWQKEFEGKSFFPMQVVEKDAKGNVESKMEVTKVEKTSLSSDLFKAPAGYHKMEIPGMGSMKMK